MLTTLLLGVFFGPLFGWSGFFEIVNRTGFTIYWIYVSHESDSEWGEDRLGREVLLDGDGFTVFLEDYPNSVFDIRVIDEDNDSYTYTNMNLEQDPVLQVVLEDLDRRR
ncbi:MAG: hypothetical protein GW949_00950 [Spirochaetales bacterium]|nr:hypothetical protein [Spirochaetales bacterium]